MTAERTQKQIHQDALADTHEAYTQFQGWTLSCLWCPYEAKWGTKKGALELINTHYKMMDCGEIV